MEETYIPSMRPLPSGPTLRDKALEIARAELGKCEHPKGSNWGPDVQKYLASIGITTPAPWCMAFVFYCVSEAAKQLSVQNPLYRTGSVINQWYHAHSNIKVTTQHPEPGDIGIMDFGEGKGHTFFVEFFKDGRVNTIEGNSNDDGSRDGYEVCRKPGGRDSGHKILGYLRIS